MAEFLSLLTLVGLTMSKTDVTQVLKSILALHTMVDAGAANALAVTPAVALPAAASIPDGTVLEIIPAHTNTGAVTLNVSGGGAVAVTDPFGNALVAGAVTAGWPQRFMKRTVSASPVWWLLGPAPASRFLQVKQFTANTRTSMVGNSGNSRTVTITPFANFVKQSATSTLIVLALSVPTFTPASPGVGAATVTLNVGSGGIEAIAANNVAATSIGQAGTPFVFTGLGAGSQAISLTYQNSAADWQTNAMPNSSDESYYPQTVAVIIIAELGP